MIFPKGNRFVMELLSRCCERLAAADIAKMSAADPVTPFCSQGANLAGGGGDARLQFRCLVQHLQDRGAKTRTTAVLAAAICYSA